jgi:phosphinothricin acetyltransferase
LLNNKYKGIKKGMEIISMLPRHLNEVLKIYEEGIATGNATFQNAVPSGEEWDKTHIGNCRLVAIENNRISGWAALTAVSGRCVYAGVAEVSIYVAAAARGKGLGKKLLQALIKESESNNYWTLQAGIFPENKASIRIHEECGFRIIGSRERIGQMNGVWRDTLLLERRSKIIGAN